VIQRNVGRGIVKDGETSLIHPGRGLMALHSPGFPKHGGYIYGPVLIVRSATPLLLFLTECHAILLDFNGMSVFGDEAEVFQGVAKSPLIARNGH
jgi:hypothetical protein